MRRSGFSSLSAIVGDQLSRAAHVGLFVARGRSVAPLAPFLGTELCTAFRKSSRTLVAQEGEFESFAQRSLDQNPLQSGERAAKQNLAA